MGMSSFHKANKWPLGEWLVGEVLMRPALRRAFRGVYASVHPETLRISRQRNVPIVFCATHSGWWDGHMAFILDRQLFHRSPYVMMEERQLARYSFFTWIGAFGVVKEDARSALASIAYITDILATEHKAALWMFPHGEMAHQDARPISILGGAARIARELQNCALVPVALRYDFLREQAPSAFARVGAPTIVGRDATYSAKELRRLLETEMTRASDKLRDDVYAYRLEEYRLILRGRGSVNANWDRVRGWVKSKVGARR
jgi:chlorobactene lauroyltransferase